MVPLISVHVAKAGGTSLLHALKNAYGESFLADYTDNPADPLSQRILDPDRFFGRNEILPPNVKCVHGHFHPGKFTMKRGTVLSTILRDPVENIISIYTYWKSRSQAGEALHQYFLDCQLSILETAKLPLLRYLYSNTYFGGFDMKRFDLVGRHDNRGSAFQRLSSLIDFCLDSTRRENVTAESEERQALMSDTGLRRQLQDILAHDLRFYERFAG